MLFERRCRKLLRAKKCGRLLFIANQTHCFERNGEISCFSSDGVESYSEREKCGRLPFISKQKNKKRSSAIPNTSHGTEKPRCHPYYGKNPVAQTPLRQVIPRLVAGNSESGSPARGNGLQQPPSLCTHQNKNILSSQFAYIIYYIAGFFKSLSQFFYFFFGLYQKNARFV